MNKLKKHEKDIAKNFVSVTECSEKTAIDTLKAADWNAESSKVDAAAVEALWRKYKDAGSEMIRADGVSRLCEDVSCDPGDVAVLVLAYHFKAAAMCEFSKEEWLTGCSALGCDSTAKLAAKLPALRASLGDDATFRAVYSFAFGFGREGTAKAVVSDVAVALWALLLPGRWHAADAWLSFFPTAGLKAVSKDTWTQVLEFSRTVKPDLSNYDPEGAWPSVIDDFAEVLKKKRAAA